MTVTALAAKHNHQYETLIFEKHDKVAVIRLNRPQALNALNSTLIRELGLALDYCDDEPTIGCTVITGSEKAFAAGADIKEMQQKTFASAYLEDFITIGWERITKCRKPIVAAVAGFALGGGCEVAMMCDFIIAAESAKFGQPEINLGIIPGAGGTQRLPRAVGKAKAMEMCLTGRMMDAVEAERAGLVSRIVPNDKLMEEALTAAKAIAAKSLPAAIMAKESINAAFDGSLTQGIHLERRLFHACFATEDQKEGMAAFIEKRPAQFKNK